MAGNAARVALDVRCRQTAGGRERAGAQQRGGRAQVEVVGGDELRIDVDQIAAAAGRLGSIDARVVVVDKVDFLEAVKRLFKDRNITVTVEAEMDETEYLLRSEENKKFLEESIEELRNGQTIKVTLEDLKK